MRDKNGQENKTHREEGMKKFNKRKYKEKVHSSQRRHETWRHTATCRQKIRPSLELQAPSVFYRKH